MKIAMLAALIFCANGVMAEEEKPVMTRAVEELTPYTEKITDAIEVKMLEAFAGGKGSNAEAARRVLAQKKQQNLEANRSPRRTMKECIKPEGLIDQDVKECMEGLRPKEW